MTSDQFLLGHRLFFFFRFAKTLHCYVLCVHNNIQIQNVCKCVQRFNLWTSTVYISSSDSLLLNILFVYSLWFRSVVIVIKIKYNERNTRHTYTLHIKERSTHNYYEYLSYFFRCCFFIISASLRLRRLKSAQSQIILFRRTSRSFF